MAPVWVVAATRLTSRKQVIPAPLPPSCLHLVESDTNTNANTLHHTFIGSGVIQIQVRIMRPSYFFVWALKPASCIVKQNNQSQKKLPETFDIRIAGCS